MDKTVSLLIVCFIGTFLHGGNANPINKHDQIRSVPEGSDILESDFPYDDPFQIKSSSTTFEPIDESTTTEAEEGDENSEEKTTKEQIDTFRTTTTESVESEEEDSTTTTVERDLESSTTTEVIKTAAIKSPENNVDNGIDNEYGTTTTVQRIILDD